MRENRKSIPPKGDNPGIIPPGAFHAWILTTSDPATSLSAAAEFFGRSLETDPDILIIRPEEGETAIKIEQVRELHQLLATRSLSGKERLVLIAPAEAVTLAGQQALLKLLEEPPDNTVIALVTRSAASLPDTVRSRCRVVQLAGHVKRESGVLAQMAEASSFAQRVRLTVNFPTEREELKSFLAHELTLPVPPTRVGITLKSRALEVYESLQVNVSPLLGIDYLTEI